MKQTLFYLPTEIFGLPLFGTGVLFWAILLAGIFAVLRAAKKKRADDAWFYATISLAGLFLVKFVGPRLVGDGAGFPIRGYGVFLMLALLISTVLTIWRAKRRWNYPPDAILSIVFVAAFFGIAGARTFYVVEYWDDIRAATFRETLINVVDLTSGGLVVYGSILGGIAAVVLYLKAKKLPILATLDLFAPALALGVSIGRIGCLMNGCCFGGPCDLPWAISFPAGSPAHVLQMEEGVASLYGLTLAEPASQTAQEAQSTQNSTDAQPTANSSETLFSLKSQHKNLATALPAPVRIAAVDPGSAAEEAGIVPGAIIREIGTVPKGLLSAEKSATAAANSVDKAKIQRFQPENNAQVFYFFLHIWNGDPKRDVWLVVENPAKSARPANSNAAAPENAATAADSTRPLPEIRSLVFRPEASRSVPVHPTQLYSSATAFVICVLLLIVAKISKRDGITFAALLIFYPINRFCLELIRTDEESFLGTGLTVSQCVSLGLLAVGVALFAYLKATLPRRALDGYFPETPEPKSTPDAAKSSEKSNDKTPRRR